MIRDYIHSVDCNALRDSISPFITTTFLGIIGLLLYTFYEEYVFRKQIDADNEEIRQNTKADVYEIEEIPHKYLHLQKLVKVLNEPTLPEWCLRDQKTYSSVIDDLLVWMRDEQHPNFADCYDVFTIIDTKEIERPRIVDEAYKWINTACILWLTHPTGIMPAWMVEPIAIRLESRKNSSIDSSRRSSSVVEESISQPQDLSSDVNS